MRKEVRIAYRDSKLTRLLQNSLGGTAASLIIVCVSSEQKNLDETVQSLRFGVRCGQIVNSLRKVDPHAAKGGTQLVRELREENERLRQDYEIAQAELRNLRDINEEWEEKYQGLKQNSKQIIQ